MSDAGDAAFREGHQKAQAGGGAEVAYGYEGKGVLIHLLADADGMPLSACSAPANKDERKQVGRLLEMIVTKTEKPGRLPQTKMFRCFSLLGCLFYVDAAINGIGSKMVPFQPKAITSPSRIRAATGINEKNHHL